MLIPGIGAIIACLFLVSVTLITRNGVTFIESQLEDALLSPFAAKLTNEPHNSIRTIVQKVERKLAHISNNGVGTVRVSHLS